jgi:Toprim-like
MLSSVLLEDDEKSRIYQGGRLGHTLLTEYDSEHLCRFANGVIALRSAFRLLSYRRISTVGDNAGLERTCLAEIKGPVVIGYDNDPAGDRMAQRAQLTRPGAIRVPPNGGKDWNQALQRADCSLLTLAAEIQTTLSLHGI